jgi:hypothetical protein
MALVLVTGCNETAPSAKATSPLPVNPSALAHLTYDCSVLAAEADAGLSGPLFYLEPFDDGGSGKSQMCAVGWDGKFRRELARGLALHQSPDGSRLLAVEFPIVNDAPAQYVVVDETNHLLARMSSIWRDEAIWGDDNRHLCYIEDSNTSGRGGVAYLELAVPGGAARRVATVGYITYLPPVPGNGGGAPSAFISGPHLAACSMRADRAVILDPETGNASVFRLSDGSRVLQHSFGHHFYPYTNQRGNETIVASIDGRYLADSVEGDSTVSVIDLLTNKAVSLHARLVSGFSSDARLVVARLDDSVVGVLDWQSGHVVTRLAGTYAWSAPRPDSEDFLIGVPSTRHQFGFDLYVVRADGTAFEVARSVEVVS